MRVGQRIRELRESRRMGLREMAGLLSLTHPTLSKYESGKAKIDADMLPRIAEVLGVSPCAFFEEEPAVAEPAVERVAQRAAEIAVERMKEELFARQAVRDVEQAFERVPEDQQTRLLEAWQERRRLREREVAPDREGAGEAEQTREDR